MFHHLAFGIGTANVQSLSAHDSKSEVSLMLEIHSLKLSPERMRREQDPEGLNIAMAEPRTRLRTDS